MVDCSKINWSVVRRCFLDVLLYLSVLILLLAIYTHLIPPTTGFFNCDDPSIWLPHRGDTFSTKILISVVFLSYLVIVFLTELSVCLKLNLTRIIKVKIAAINTANSFMRFFLSLTWNVCINLILKTLSAVPRPHFISTCNPDWSRINCSQFRGNVEYDISLCQVTEEHHKEVFDAMKSFPSGHAQIACFTSAFLIIYLHKRLKVESVLLVYWVQLVLVIMASVSSLSRITDNRHHASDVWVGAVLGLVVAIIGAGSLDQVADSSSITAKQSQIGLLGAALRGSSNEKHTKDSGAAGNDC